MNSYGKRIFSVDFHGFEKNEEFERKCPVWRDKAIEICKLLQEGLNIGLVADTAAGKTIMAILAIYGSERKALFLTPQRILADQHDEVSRKIIKGDFKTKFIHGGVSTSKRNWKNVREDIVFATPQVIEIDMEKGILDLSQFDLVVFDEMHRAVGDYSYVNLAEIASEKGIGILGLSASPGGSLDEIEIIKKNLHLNKFLMAKIHTPLKGEDIVIAKMDETLISIDSKFKSLLKEVLGEIRDLGVEIEDEDPTLREFSEIEKKAKGINMYKGAYLCAKYLKLRHAYFIVITESYDSFLEYLSSLKTKDRTKAAKEIVEDRRIWEMAKMAKSGLHPKEEKLFEILSSMSSFGRTGLVFIFQKSTARNLALKCLQREMHAEVLFGGKDKKIERQKKVLNDLSKRKINYVFTTSVSEEGLSVPEIDAVIHYAMPSKEISLIQRGGRTGRMRYGNIIFIAIDHPFDKAMLYPSRKRARDMKKIIDSDGLSGLPQGRKREVEVQKTTPPKSKKRRGRWKDEYTLPLFPEE